MNRDGGILCRLFDLDRPFEQLDARSFEGGRITLGRDPAADWRLPDVHRLLSRIHCTLSLVDGRVFVYDQSTNGTFLDTGERAPKYAPVELAHRRSFQIGGLGVSIEQRDEAESTLSPTSAPLVAPPSASAPPVPARCDPTHAPGARRSPAQAAPDRASQPLLEAFCEGAGLDVSALTSEEPDELMRRLGEIYRQTVLGLSALMAERARTKSDLQLERTTISAADNNPFKWTEARALAEDLLRPSELGFLWGAEAVGASFGDLNRHLGGLMQGVDATSAAAMQALAPDAIEAEARERGSLLRSRAAACWEIYARRYRETVGEEKRGSALRQAFAHAYAHVGAPS